MTHTPHHPRHHEHDPHATADTPGATYDPVCGHWVVPEKAPASTAYRGETIHFCSLACHRAFTTTPERFFPRYLARPGRATALQDAAPSPRRMGFLDKIRPATPPGNVTDPVCHMSVDPKTARGGSTEHQGQTYWFCSPGCKAKFEKEPAKFLSGGGGAHHMG